MKLPSEFRTQRLCLRQWRDSDVEPFASFNADPRVMEFFPSMVGPEASAAAVARWRAQIDERGWGLWAVEAIESSQLIGFVGLQIPAATLPFGPCVEIGWRLGFAYWGQGLATEAARQALRVGFERLELEKIVSFTAVHKQRSRAVMERLGMSEADRFEHPGIAPTSPLRQHVLYRLSRTQWQDDALSPRRKLA